MLNLQCGDVAAGRRRIGRGATSFQTWSYLYASNRKIFFLPLLNKYFNDFMPKSKGGRKKVLF